MAEAECCERPHTGKTVGRSRHDEIEEGPADRVAFAQGVRVRDPGERDPGPTAGETSRTCRERRIGSADLARIASMSRTPTGPSRIRAERDRIVGSNGSSASAHSTIVAPAGGSSRVLSSAACASSFRRCG